MKKIIIFLIILSFLFLSTNSSEASRVGPSATLGDLVLDSDIIVIGAVKKIEQHMQLIPLNRVKFFTTIEIEKILKNNIKESKIVIIYTNTAGLPACAEDKWEFHTQEKYLFFLNKSKDKNYYQVAASFPIQNNIIETQGLFKGSMQISLNDAINQIEKILKQPKTRTYYWIEKPVSDAYSIFLGTAEKIEREGFGDSNKTIKSITFKVEKYLKNDLKKPEIVIDYPYEFIYDSIHLKQGKRYLASFHEFPDKRFSFGYGGLFVISFEHNAVDEKYPQRWFEYGTPLEEVVKTFEEVIGTIK